VEVETGRSNGAADVTVPPLFLLAVVYGIAYSVGAGASGTVCPHQHSHQYHRTNSPILDDYAIVEPRICTFRVLTEYQRIIRGFRDI
jgi:hypothetical protein